MPSPSDIPTFLWLDAHSARASHFRAMFCSARTLKFLVPCLFLSAFLSWRYPITHFPTKQDIRNSIQTSIQASIQTTIEPWVQTANPVLNGTLGFEKILVLTLPEREDRRAAIMGAANATNMTLENVGAIRDEHIPESAQPPHWNETKHRSGELGCFMSHVKAWREMITSNVTSALILESDADWDMRIKPTMLGLAEAAKALIDWPFPRPTISTSATHPRNFSTSQKPVEHKIHEPNSPYGQDWDVLWVGHCGTSGDGDGRIYTYDDPSAPSDKRAHTVKDGPKAGHRPAGNGTRIVFQFDHAMCTTGYAISNAGARKLDSILRSTSKNGGAKDPVDKWMWWQCRDDPSLSCLGVWPTIFSAAKSKSNIGGEDSSKDEGVSAGLAIQISARVNAKLGLATQGEDSWKREYDTMDDKEG